MTPNDAIKNASPSAVILALAARLSPEAMRALSGKLLDQANAVEYQQRVDASRRHAQTSIDAARLVLGQP